MLGYLKGFFKPTPPPLPSKPSPADRVTNSPSLHEAYCLILDPKLLNGVNRDYREFTNKMIGRFVDFLYGDTVKAEFEDLRELNYLLHMHPTDTPEVYIKSNVIIQNCPYYNVLTNNLWVMNHSMGESDLVEKMVLVLDEGMIGKSPTINTGNNLLSDATNAVIQTWVITFNLKLNGIKILNDGKTVIVKGVNNKAIQVGGVAADFKQWHEGFYKELRSLR